MSGAYALGMVAGSDDAKAARSGASLGSPLDLLTSLV